MHYYNMIKPDKNRLHIYHEGRKRRTFVGDLFYDADKDKYVLTYDENYASSKTAIPISPDLSLFKLKHYSKKGELFPAFVDRIPDKSNPAYAAYCVSQGISPEEGNPIILLGAIGKRGPSSFIFEPVYNDEFDLSQLTALREKFEITQHDFALALDINKATLQRIEAGESSDANTLKRLQIYFQFPEVALWQLRQTGGRVHKDVLETLQRIFWAKEKFDLKVK